MTTANGLIRTNYMVWLPIIAIALFLSLNITSSALAQPSINEPSLRAELVLDGLSSPTNIAFLDNNNILLLEKEGSVRLISNGQIQPQPILQLEGVESNNERGLLGIELMDNKAFLYVTESGAQVEGIPTEGDVRNRVYSYTWDGTSLTNPQLLLDLPSGPGTNHQGGDLKIGPDNQLYVVVGEMQREGQLQNFQSGPPPDDTGVIFRVNPVDGSPSSGNPFSSDASDPLSKYYAYGIRNSFGIDFDPVTGKLWDAENGEDVFDEINLVEPGFNSGWKQVMGPIAANTGVSESNLVNLAGSQYVDPVFSWAESRGVTDIEAGPDGNLYVLTFDRETEGQGSVYRILPASEVGAATVEDSTASPQPSPSPPTPPTDAEEDSPTPPTNAEEDSPTPPTDAEEENEIEQDAGNGADGDSDDEGE